MLTILDQTSATSTSGKTLVTVDTPDVSGASLLFAVVAWPYDANPDEVPEEGEDWPGGGGWEVVSFLDGDNHKIALLRRTVEDEPESYTFEFNVSEFLETTPIPIVVLLAVQESTGGDEVASGIAEAEGETVFEAPDATAAAVTDVLLNVFYTTREDGFEVGETQVLQDSGNDNDPFELVARGSILVTLEELDAAGPVGTREATALDTVSGAAATFILTGTGASALLVAPDFRSTIGLVPVGT